MFPIVALECEWSPSAVTDAGVAGGYRRVFAVRGTPVDLVRAR